MRPSRLILKLLGVIPKVYPLVGVEVDILGRILRLGWQLLTLVGGSPTEQILLIYSCLVLRFSLSVIFLLLDPDHLIFVLLVVFIGRILLIIVMVFIALVQCLPAIQRVLLYLLIVISAVILWVALLSLKVPGSGRSPLGAVQLICLIIPEVFLTWHSV